MACVDTNGVRLEYDLRGATDCPAIVLIRGLGSQLIHWPETLLDGLTSRGFRTIRYDNRDAGLSSKFDGFSRDKITQALTRLRNGETMVPPYSLEDMAADCMGLVECLELNAVHIVGCSMGGMIAQTIAARAPEKTLSLTSIYSTSGDPQLPSGTPEALAGLVSGPADPGDSEAVIAHAVAVARLIGSPAYPETEEMLYVTARRAFERCYCPDGYMRQYLAMKAASSRVDLLRSIRVPALVLHGRDDPLFPVECALSTVEQVPGATLKLIDGWGHDLPEALIPELVDAIVRNARQASQSAVAAND